MSSQRNSVGILLAVLTIPILSFPSLSRAANGGETGNGGDSYAREFIAQAVSLADLMQGTPAVSGLIPMNAFRDALKATRVTTQDTLVLNGQEVDALNFPAEHRIELNRTSWDRMKGMPIRRALLELHEYLGILGLEVNQYNVSINIGIALGIDFSAAIQPLPSAAQAPASVPPGYVKWSNGGGWVDPSASITPSAYIDSNSTVGPNVIIGADVQILSSNLENACFQSNSSFAPSRLGNGARVENSKLSGRWTLGKTSRVTQSTLAGDCKDGLNIEDSVTVNNSSVADSTYVETATEIVDSTLSGSASIEEQGLVRRSHVASASIESRCLIDNSDLSGGVEIEDGNTVRNSIISGGRAGDNNVIMDSTLTNVSVEDGATIRSSKLDHTTVPDGAVISQGRTLVLGPR